MVGQSDSLEANELSENLPQEPDSKGGKESPVSNASASTKPNSAEKEKRPTKCIMAEKPPAGMTLTDVAQLNKIIPKELIEEEKSCYLFDDVFERNEWSLDPTIMYNFPNKIEALIQIGGNWRLCKWRKTNEIYDCLQCKVQLVVQKHPSFCEVNLMPPEGVKYDPNDLENPTSFRHTPFDAFHLKIKGVTHANVRYFAKKHW